MAFLKDSRYGALARFDPAPDGTTPFKGVKPRPLPAATPVLEHKIAMKERLDQLAQNYYRNPRDWTRLAAANPEDIFAEDLIWHPEPAAENGSELAGHVLLVPRRREGGS